MPPLGLKKIVSSFDAMIQGPQFEVISIPHLYQHIIEGFFTHFFPESGSVYSKSDIEFLLLYINQQDKLRSSNNQSQSLINPAKFKLHLDRILCKGWSNSGASADPLFFYKVEVRE